ncbi:MAG: hypothetical protein MUF61_01180 [archaeon]|jgi:hypothetical protein|nr:hypothetical protein [archaeon]
MGIKSLRGQSAVEFMILVGAVLVFMVAFFGALEANRADKLRESRENFLNDVALSVRDEVNLAYSASDGYEREFIVPNKAFGLEFNITFVGTSVYLRTIDGKYALAQPINNVTGEIKTGSNIIRKNNGLVYLNQ